MSVAKFTVLTEAVGTVILWQIFRRAGQTDALWSGIFHSVSAFCTAGFSLNNSSFESFAGNFWLNLTIAVLSYLGAMGKGNGFPDFLESVLTLQGTYLPDLSFWAASFEV